MKMDVPTLWFESADASRPSSLQTQETPQDVTHSPTRRAAQPPPPARRRGSSSSPADNAAAHCRNNRRFCWFIVIFYGLIPLWVSEARGCGRALVRSTIEELQTQKDWSHKIWSYGLFFKKNIRLFPIHSENLPAPPTWATLRLQPTLIIHDYNAGHRQCTEATLLEEPFSKVLIEWY